MCKLGTRQPNTEKGGSDNGLAVEGFLNRRKAHERVVALKGLVDKSATELDNQVASYASGTYVERE